MEEVKGSIAVGKSEITLTPASHHYTLVWLVGMGEEPQKALDFLLSREILQVKPPTEAGAAQFPNRDPPAAQEVREDH